MNFSPIYKIKEGKVDRVKEWLRELGGERRDEALATFRYENIVREGYLLFEVTEEECYLIGFNESFGDNTKKSDPNVKINKEHDAFKRECLLPITKEGVILLDLKL